jgi:hypothetical protein
MTKEEKQLLLKDLCARLPYGVMVHFEGWNPEKLYEINLEIGICNAMGGLPIPYLRPMSNMTEEEKEELKQEHVKDEKLYAECLTKAANGDDSMRGKVIPHFAADWCNKNHFDYCGLIPMGLALEAPKDMYKI